jgi:tetratricopeptide (TPR) repeat protein
VFQNARAEPHRARAAFCSAGLQACQGPLGSPKGLRYVFSVVAFVSFVPFVSFVAAQPPQPSEAEAALSAARKLVDAGQPRAAIDKLNALGDSGNPLVAQLLGVAYFHANDPARAIEHLAAVLTRLAAGSLERREAVQVLGLSHYLAGHLAESIPYLEEVRLLMPDDVKLAYTLGMAYAQTRQPDKAREAFARTFHVAPDSAAGHLIAGQMMNRLELEAFAEAELNTALQKEPKLPEAHYLLGQIAIFRSRLDEGLALMRDELAINPAHAMALYRIGDIYSRQLKWDAAIAALQQSLWINPYYSGPYILLGKAYSKTGQLAAAEDMLRRAVRYDPNNKSAHYLLAQVLQQAGRADEAKREFAIAERLQGDAVK